MLRSLMGQCRSVTVLATEFQAAPDEDIDPSILQAVASDDADRRRRVRDLSQLDFELRLERKLGPPPWADDRFHVLACLDPGWPIWLYGADYTPYASAAASLEWYLRGCKAPPGPEVRAEALIVLEEHDRRRREFQARVIERVLALVVSKPPETDVFSYALIRGRLNVVRKGEIPAAEALLVGGPSPAEGYLTSAVDALRTGR